jgi:hypothetical protein
MMTPTAQVVVGLLIAAISACATIYGGYLAKLGFDGLSTSSASRPTQTAAGRGPTLEAIDHSVIDATGATIPGDLSFQFGRAEGHSLIAMPGVTVTKNDDGTYSVIPPAQTNLSFPAPDGRFSKLSNLDLKKEAALISAEFRQAQGEFIAAYQAVKRDEKGQISNQDWQAFSEPLDNKYRADLVPMGFSIVCELLNRTAGNLQLSDGKIRIGAQDMYYRQVASAGHADKVADFIDFLLQKVPDQ